MLTEGGARSPQFAQPECGARFSASNFAEEANAPRFRADAVDRHGTSITGVRRKQMIVEI